MENITWEKILLALGAVGGALTGGVPFFKWLSGLVEEKRKARLEKNAAHLSTSADIRRIEIENRDQTNELLLKIIEVKDEECRKLNDKIATLEQSYSLPRPLANSINSAMRAASRQIDTVRSLVERGEKKENVILEIDILDQKIDDVNKLLP